MHENFGTRSDSRRSRRGGRRAGLDARALLAGGSESYRVVVSPNHRSSLGVRSAVLSSLYPRTLYPFDARPRSSERFRAVALLRKAPAAVGPFALAFLPFTLHRAFRAEMAGLTPLDKEILTSDYGTTQISLADLEKLSSVQLALAASCWPKLDTFARQKAYHYFYERRRQYHESTEPKEDGAFRYNRRVASKDETSLTHRWPRCTQLC